MKVIEEAIEFGVPMDEGITRANPLRYVFIFLVPIIMAVYLGVSASATLWDVLHGNPALSQDPDLITRWAGYSMANYGAPIVVVLILSYFGWTVNHQQPASYPISYARIFAIALCVSAFSLASAFKFASGSPKPFVEILFSDFKWSYLPLWSRYMSLIMLIDKSIPYCPILLMGNYSSA